VNKHQKFNVDDAYAVKTPADNIRLYGEWAETYEEDLVNNIGYVVYLRVAEHMICQRSLLKGPVLDVGCGTGLVGECLRKGGIDVIDGIDISPLMIAEAGKKKTQDGDPVYRRLITADLTKKLNIPDGQYAGFISAGTFTKGHLGPDSLDELWRIAASGAISVIGVKSTHYTAAHFHEKLSSDVTNGTITKPDIVEVNMYSEKTNNPQHADDKYLIVMCRLI
jgi:ubiquinone/menaquinone biosynthesis C-methylase UbiE